jgi:hypothetical protein
MYMVPRNQNLTNRSQGIFGRLNMHNYITLLLWSCFNGDSFKTASKVAVGDIQWKTNSPKRIYLPEKNFWNNCYIVVHLQKAIESSADILVDYLLTVLTNSLTNKQRNIAKADKTFYYSMYRYVFTRELMELIVKEGLNPTVYLTDTQLKSHGWTEDVDKFGILFTFVFHMPKILKELLTFENTNFSGKANNGFIECETLFKVDISNYFEIPVVFQRKGFKKVKMTPNEDGKYRTLSNEEYNKGEALDDTDLITMDDFPLSPTVADLYYAATNNTERNSNNLLKNMIETITEISETPTSTVNGKNSTSKPPISKNKLETQKSSTHPTLPSKKKYLTQKK